MSSLVPSGDGAGHWSLGVTILSQFGYDLGAVGDRTELVETVDEVISTAGTLGYSYDEVGNRTNRTSNVSAIDPAIYAYNTNDWLTTDGYDDNGNTTTRGTNTFEYDHADRLTNVNGGEIVMVYNADGHRVSNVTGGITTLYMIDSRNYTGYAQVLEELEVDGSNTNLSRAYTYGLDLLSQRDANDTVHFYGYDGHGSVRFLTDTNGVLIDSYVYDAYGSLIQTNRTTPNSYLYTGEQFDPDLGFYYLRARYLDPDSGRF